jgi:hypothetical protein
MVFKINFLIKNSIEFLKSILKTNKEMHFVSKTELRMFPLVIKENMESESAMSLII